MLNGDVQRMVIREAQTGMEGDSSTPGAQEAHEKRAEWHGDVVLAKTVSEGLLP